jgi:hypothetical protein
MQEEGRKQKREEAAVALESKYCLRSGDEIWFHFVVLVSSLHPCHSDSVSDVADVTVMLGNILVLRRSMHVADTRTTSNHSELHTC